MPPAAADAAVIEVPAKLELESLKGKSLKDLRGLRDQRNAVLHEAFVEAGPDLDMSKVSRFEGDSAQKAAEFKRLNTELSAIGEQIDEVADLEGIRDNLPEPNTRKSAGRALGLETTDAPPGSGDEPVGNPRALKALLEQDSPFKEAVDLGIKFADGRYKDRQFPIGEITYDDFLAIKATITLGDIAPVNVRRPDIVPSAQERFTVADLMLSGTIAGKTYSYMEETTFTNAAVETAENTAKPESTLDFTERTDTLAKIATWVPATDEVLDDNPGLESYIRGRLVFMVEQRREQQLLVGDGTLPNISGITDRSGIQTQAKGADPTPDAFYKAMVKIMTTGDADPTGHVINPLDWQDIRLLRTADGIYIWGNPSEAGPERLWGLPVRVTSAMTQNTGLTGAFRPFAQIFRKPGAGITVAVSTEHASYFIENKVAILAEERLLLAVYRPAAFCTVTGI
jgi:HK97 family phage major capsid protein